MKRIIKFKKKNLSRYVLAIILAMASSVTWAVSEDTGMLDNALSNNNSAQSNLNNQLNTQMNLPNALGTSLTNNPSVITTPAGNTATPPASVPSLAPAPTSASTPASTTAPAQNTIPSSILASPPASPVPQESMPVVTNAGVADQAFSNMTRGLLPLSPEQIRMLHYLFDQSRKSAAESPQLPPKPTSSSVVVNLSPGATPPVIRLAAGFVTSLVFLDTTGAAWPIHAYDLGDPKGFNIQWNKKSNTLLVQASDAYKSGNLAVMLEGLNTPVMLTLLPGQQAIDYRVDLRVPGLGPNALTAMDETPGTGDPQLLSVLDGIPPTGSKQVEVLGGECQAWLSNDGHLYLRTRLTLLSPGWISVMTSADGMHAYQIQKTPVILASSRGKVVQLSIQGL